MILKTRNSQQCLQLLQIFKGFTTTYDILYINKFNNKYTDIYIYIYIYIVIYVGWYLVHPERLIGLPSWIFQVTWRYRALPFTSTQQGPGKDSHPTGAISGFCWTTQPLSKTEENAEAHCAGEFDLNSHRFKRWRIKLCSAVRRLRSEKDAWAFTAPAPPLWAKCGSRGNRRSK